MLLQPQQSVFLNKCGKRNPEFLRQATAMLAAHRLRSAFLRRPYAAISPIHPSLGALGERLNTLLHPV